MKNRLIYMIITCLLVAAMPLYAQQTQKVSGKVKDLKTGDELIGVTVNIKGTKKNAITDVNGNYSIIANNTETDVLTFSYIGYDVLEEPLKNRTTVDVEMSESVNVLSETIVVGYGTQKKESVIGSFSSIGNKSLVSVPASNITQSLAGKLSGIQVVQSSGELGDDVAAIYVRGQGTWNDPTPLYIVDGVVRAEFAKLDPNEIESINILKDASATAVFGVKGANGVIIVTTKRGALGKARVSLTAQNAITEPINIPQPLGAYDAQSLQYLQDWGGGIVRSAVSNYGTGYDLMLWRTGASPWTHPDVDLVDEIMKKYSSQQQYNVNVSGGSKTVKYFVSGGYLTQDGFYKHDNYTNYNRFNFRSNLDVNVTKNLTASLNIGARVENLTSPQSTIWSSWEIYRGSFANNGRNYPIYNPDGSYAGQGSNLVASLEASGIYKDIKSTLETNLNLIYKMDFITKGLSARAQVAFDNQGENGRSWSRSVKRYVYTQSTNSYQAFLEDSPLTYSGVQKNYNWYNIYMEAGLNYDRTFGKHTVTGLFLMNRNEKISDVEIAFADQGLISRATYDYDKRYFAEVNVGYNGSENFPKTNRYGFFPAFAAGWMVSNEDFIANNPIGNFLTKLKIRASLGWVGNDKSKIGEEKQRFMFLQLYNNAGGYNFGVGNNFISGIQQGAIANITVMWEVARKENIGFEAEFLKGLFGINFDYFHEFRNKILTDVNGVKPNYVGANFSVANVGETTNQGFEIELTHNKTINKNFSYYVKGNYTFNRNKVIKRADKEGLLQYQKEEGYSIGTILMSKSIGYFNSYEEIQSSPSQLSYHNGLSSNVEVVPGDLKFLDFNNDGVINQDDSYRQGYGTVPEMQYGVTLGGTWKAFDFSVLFQGSANAQFVKQWEIMWAFSNSSNVFDKHNYYWSPETASSAQFTRYYGKTWYNNERYYSTYEVGSGNYIRIKNIELGYNLPNKLIKRIGISSARVYLSSINTYMWAKEKYLDPDNRDIRGGKMPATRAFNAGLNINF